MIAGQVVVLPLDIEPGALGLAHENASLPATDEVCGRRSRELAAGHRIHEGDNVLADLEQSRKNPTARVETDSSVP